MGVAVTTGVVVVTTGVTTGVETTVKGNKGELPMQGAPPTTVMVPYMVVGNAVAKYSKH
jgi:hypothetical protein